MKRSVFLTTPLSGPLFMATPAFSSPPYSYRLPSLQFSGGRAADVVELQLRACRAQQFGRKILATTIYLEDKALNIFA